MCHSSIKNISHFHSHVETNSLADLRGRKGYGPPRSIFFHFRVVLGKNYPKNRLAPPLPHLGLGSSRLGNPGSATGTNMYTRKPFSHSPTTRWLKDPIMLWRQWCGWLLSHDPQGLDTVANADRLTRLKTLPSRKLHSAGGENYSILIYLSLQCSKLLYW